MTLTERELPAPPMPAPGAVVRADRDHRVIVLGAGMAGLVAAHELNRRGYRPLVLEARRRVGGRVYTVRDFAPDLYAEAGAMRIPRSHRLTLDYCRRFGLGTRPAAVRTAATRLHVRGKGYRYPWSGPGDNPFALSAAELAVSCQQRWGRAIAEPSRAFRRGGVDELIRRYGHQSIYGFLKGHGWSDGAIEEYGVLSFSESNLATSVVQEFREHFADCYEAPLEIIGGMDRLPRALYRRLARQIRFGVEVVAIRQRDAGIEVHATVAGSPTVFRGDAVICTLPFSVLRGIDVSPALSSRRRRLIRQLHYDAATKTYLQLRRPSWQDSGLAGGFCATDLRIRRVVYPPRTDPDARCLLLASYTWGQDAQQWSAMDERQRVERTLADLERIHPGMSADFEAGFSYAWHTDRFAMGAYALPQPGQHLGPADFEPEGRLHFAGEHCSPWPAWIEGAVHSGQRAAREVHDRCQARQAP